MRIPINPKLPKCEPHVEQCGHGPVRCYCLKHGTFIAMNPSDIQKPDIWGAGVFKPCVK